MVVANENGRAVLHTHQGPQENSCRPAVDVLFRSVADLYKSHALAVEMTGMGQDGLRGCELIREHGGQILAQDQASSVVWGMPGFVANAGLADKVMPLDQLGMEIIRRVRNGRASVRPHPSTVHMVESSSPR
jgi:two-component system, chemotaxis family, protein-glutamate methylesterase/glutaminase